MRTLIIRLTGQAQQVFETLEAMSKVAGKDTIGQILNERGKIL